MSMMIETAITFLKESSSFMMTILDHPQFIQQIIMIGLAIAFGFLIKQSLKTFFSII